MGLIFRNLFLKINLKWEIPNFLTFSLNFRKNAVYEGLIFPFFFFVFVTLTGTGGGEKRYPGQRHIPVHLFAQVAPIFPSGWPLESNLAAALIPWR